MNQVLRSADRRFHGLEFERVVLVPGQQRRRFEGRYAFVFPQSGSGTLSCGTQSCPSTADSAYAFGPGCLWNAHADSGEDWNYHTLFVDRHTLRNLLRTAAAPVDAFEPPGLYRFGPKTGEAARRLFRQFNGRRHLLERAAALMDFIGAAASEARSIPVRRQEAPVLAVSRRYLLKHLPSRVRVRDLARASSLSRFYFHRQFRNVAGISPYIYAMLWRIDRAEQLLREGCAISDVAQRAGFYDQSHLNRCFRRAVGMTPRRYQQTSSVAERPVITAATVFAYRFRDGEPLLQRWKRLRATSS
jgi:AraC-like DNA-binding protein